MENINFELLNDLINLYTGVGIMLIIVLGITIIYVIYRVIMNLSEENEKLNKKIRVNEIKQVIKEIKDNEEK